MGFSECEDSILRAKGYTGLDKGMPRFVESDTGTLMSMRRERRSMGTAITKFGNVLVKTGQRVLIWNRGREAIGFLLEDATFLFEKYGYDIYFKNGGISRAIKDFNKARLTKRRSIQGEDGSKFYYGTAGEVKVELRIIHTRPNPFVSMAIEKKATDIRKGYYFEIYYK